MITQPGLIGDRHYEDVAANHSFHINTKDAASFHAHLIIGATPRSARTRTQPVRRISYPARNDHE